MADRIMFVGWGAPVRGSEDRGLGVFNEALGLYGRMQQDGRIEGFDVVLLEPHESLGGYIQVRGSSAQLAAVREDKEFQRNMIDAGLVVDDLRIIQGYTNEGVAEQMALYQEAIAKVPQRA